MTSDNFHIRTMRPSEVDIAIEWARLEGWNPGIYDGECHYAVDPDGWFIGEVDDEPVATAVFTNYDSRFSFAGFYIVRPGYRHQTYGQQIWNAGLAHTEGRNLGGDGVYEMMDKYQKISGFNFAYRNIRWEGVADGKEQEELVPVGSLPFEEILAYDTDHFPVSRRKFLEKWISQPESTALAFPGKDNTIQGYGMIRRCFTGHKIGPIFADTPEIAEKIFQGLTASIPGEPVFFDTPEPNSDAIAIARRHNMTEIFGTARMYTGNIPDLPINNIFGVTTFELG